MDVLQDEVDRISFGTMITVTKSGIMASHVPMLIDRSRGELGTVFGHVAAETLNGETPRLAVKAWLFF